VSILCAGVPEAPPAPTTVNFENKVIISWQAPPDNGEPLLGYYVYIRQTNGDYSLELEHCDGTDQDIILALSCTIPLNTLTQSPFALQFGSQEGEQVNVKIVAFNEYGNSPPSAIGGTARI
jgi:hypothetical protein